MWNKNLQRQKPCDEKYCKGERSEKFCAMCDRLREVRNLAPGEGTDEKGTLQDREEPWERSDKGNPQVRRENLAGQRRKPCRSEKGTLQVREGNAAGQKREPCRSEKGTLQVREGSPAGQRREPCRSEKCTVPCRLGRSGKGTLQQIVGNHDGLRRNLYRLMRGTLQAERNPAG